MARKLYRHPSVGFVLDLGTEKLHITNEEVKAIEIETEGLQHVPADIEVSAVLDNALTEAQSKKSADYIKGVQFTVQDMIEKFEGPEA